MNNHPLAHKWDCVYSMSTEAPWENADLPVRALQEFSDGLPAGGRILDYGCGSGRIASVFDAFGYEVCGVDCSQVALARAVHLENGRYFQANALAEIESGLFDGVILWGVLHHYPPEEWKSWIDEIFKCLKDGGRVLVGIFDESDTKFQGRRFRLSLTTDRECWCGTADRMRMLVSETNSTILACNKIELSDGVPSRELRTWLYLIYRSGTKKS